MSASTKKLLAALRKKEGRDWQKPVAHFLKAHKLSAADTEVLGLDVYNIALKEAVANLNIATEEAANLRAIQTFFGLSEEAVRELHRSYAPKAMQMMLDWFLIDNILTPSEEAQLTAFGKEMSLTEAEIADFMQKAMEGKK